MTGPLLVDLGGTRVRAALGMAGELQGRVEERTNQAEGPNGVVEQIVRLAGAVALTTGAQFDRAVVSTPGPVDPGVGVVYSPPNMAGWGDVPLAALLSERLRVPVRLINDANAAALGEFRYGAGRGARHLVYLTISTGIGGGVVVDGQLLEGRRGAAGELGHTTVDLHGPRCACGNVGCLEAVASGTSIARLYIERGGREGSQAEDVFRAAAEGDREARSVVDAAAEAIGVGVVNAIHTFNPDIVVLGGGVMGAGAAIWEPVQRIVAERVMDGSRGAKVVPAQLGENAGLMGTLALDQDLP